MEALRRQGNGDSGMNDQPPILEIENLRTWFPIKRGILSKTVGYVKAVDGVSLHIGKGEILVECIVAHNCYGSEIGGWFSYMCTHGFSSLRFNLQIYKIWFCFLPVLTQQLKMGLGVGAGRAFFRWLISLMQVTTIRAVPDNRGLALEDLALHPFRV